MSKQRIYGQLQGRTMTAAEYDAVLRIEKQRSRWSRCVLLSVMLAVSVLILMALHAAGARLLERACVRELGINPRYAEANYHAYCMIEYHDHVNGTDYDYFSRENRRSISDELESQMREAYYLGYLYAPAQERIDFKPEYTQEQFEQRVQIMMDEVKTRLLDASGGKVILAYAITGAALILVAVMIMFPGGRKRLEAYNISCRRGVAYIPSFCFLDWVKPVHRAYIQAEDETLEFSATCSVTWWNTPPREAGLFMRMAEVPVLIVMADEKIRYYPLALLDKGKAAENVA